MLSISQTMCTTMFRISHKGKELAHADTLEHARQIILPQVPGRYDVDELHDDPLCSTQTAKAWGSLIRHPDGRIEDDPWTTLDSTGLS